MVIRNGSLCHKMNLHLLIKLQFMQIERHKFEYNVHIKSRLFTVIVVLDISKQTIINALS